MKSVIKTLIILLCINICSCNTFKKKEENNAIFKDSIKIESTKKSKEKILTQGYFVPTRNDICLNKLYRFINLEMWLPDKYDPKGIYQMRFESNNPKPLYIKFRNCLRKSDTIILTDSDTLNGEIYFQGTFFKLLNNEVEIMNNKIIVLSGTFKIKGKDYKVDFTYFPGD